jgi:patatin-like phospholipase/acyl hydrolase
LDGGGTKVIYQYKLVSYIAKTSKKKLTEIFDTFIGVSCGALLSCIIAMDKLDLF